MSQRFENKVVVITGGSSGIGLECTRLFLAEGGKVWVADRGGPLSESLRKEHRAVNWVKTDVNKDEDLAHLFAEVGSKHSHIDVLLPNAGVASFASIMDTTREVFHSLFATNVQSVFFTVQHALPLLREGSRVVLVSSFLANVGMKNASALSASKAAVGSLARSMAAELSDRGIRVNAVSPGPIETPLLGKLGFSKDQAEGFAAKVIAGVPMNRLGKATEVAKAIAFLASADASYTTGAELAVDGGAAQL